MLSPDLNPADAASLHPQHCLLNGWDDLQTELTCEYQGQATGARGGDLSNSTTAVAGLPSITF